MVSATHQHEAALGIPIVPLPLEAPSGLPPHPFSLGCHRGMSSGPPVSYTELPLATHLTYGKVSVSAHSLKSRHPLLPNSVQRTQNSPLLPCKYYLSRTIISTIRLSLVSSFYLSFPYALGSSTSLGLTQMGSFYSWVMIFHYCICSTAFISVSSVIHIL